MGKYDSLLDDAPAAGKYDSLLDQPAAPGKYDDLIDAPQVIQDTPPQQQPAPVPNSLPAPAATSPDKPYDPYTGLTQFKAPDSWKQYGAVLEAKQQLDEVLSKNKPDETMPPDLRDKVTAYNKQYSDEYERLLSESTPEVQEAVRRDELFNEAKVISKQLQYFENAPPDYPAKAKLQARMDEINDELHLTDDTFMVRAKSGRAKLGIDVVRYGQWSTHARQKLAVAVEMGDLAGAQRLLDDMNEVDAAVADTLPQGKSTVGKGWYGFLGSSLPMGESIAAGLFTGGTADKAYWVAAGTGEIFRTWTQNDGRKLADIPADELEKAKRIAAVGGVIYGGVEYVSGLVPGLKQTGIPWADKFAQRFIKEAWDNPALINRLMKGGIRAVFSWLGETAEEGMQNAVVSSSNALMEDERIDAYDNILKPFGDGAWQAKESTALMALFGVAGGNVNERLQARRWENEQRAKYEERRKQQPGKYDSLIEEQPAAAEAVPATMEGEVQNDTQADTEPAGNVEEAQPEDAGTMGGARKGTVVTIKGSGYPGDYTKNDKGQWIKHTGNPVESDRLIEKLEYRATKDRNKRVDEAIQEEIDNDPILSVVEQNGGIRMPDLKPGQKYSDESEAVPKNWRSYRGKVVDKGGVQGPKGLKIDDAVMHIWPNAGEFTGRDFEYEITERLQAIEAKREAMKRGDMLLPEEQDILRLESEEQQLADEIRGEMVRYLEDGKKPPADLVEGWPEVYDQATKDMNLDPATLEEGYDESQLDDSFDFGFDQEETSAETGKEVPDATAVESTAPVNTEQPPATPEAGAPPAGAEGKPIRGFAGRAAESEQLTEEQRKDVLNNPENYYEPQNYEDMEGLVDQLNTSEKWEALAKAGTENVEGNANLGVMAGLSLMNEEIAAGRDPAPVIEALAKKGTTVAQLLAQYRLLKSANPEYAVSLFEKELNKAGLQLTDQRRAQLESLNNADMQAVEAMRKAGQEMSANPTRQTVDAYKKAMRAAERSKRRLMNRYAELAPRTGADLYRNTIRGNLLVPKSHKRNVLSNLIMRPIYDVAQTAGAVVDAVDSFITGRARVLRRGSIRGSISGAVEGLRRAGIGMVLGSQVDQDIKGERHRGFKPLSAWRQLLRHDLPVNAQGRTPARVWIGKIYEGTIGVLPEINFRLLQLGDDPFKYSVYRSNLYQEAKARGLKGAAREAFMLKPPAKVAKAAMDAAQTSVFQQTNMAGQAVAHARKMLRDIPVVGQWMDAAVITPLLPYVVTPANVAKTLFKLSMPEITMTAGVAQFMYGRKKSGATLRRGEMNMGYAAVGYVLKGAALWLIEKGLVSEPPSDEEKERTLSYQTTKPGRLNLDALNRAMHGGSAEWQDGDRTINLIALGFPGAVIQIHARKVQMAREEQRRLGGLSEELPPATGPLADVPDTMVAAVQATLDQSFVQGIYNVLDAVKSGRVETLIQDYLRAATAVTPNTLGVVVRANQEYLPDTKLDFTGRSGSILAQAYRNAINERNPFVDWDTVYPHRFDPLGNVIKRTPDNVPAFMYQLWSDSEPYQVEPEWQEIRRVYEATGMNTDAIPSGASRSITLPAGGNSKYAGKTIPLLPSQYARLGELVGKARGERVRRLLESKGYWKLNAEQQMQQLKKAYSEGANDGRKIYIMETYYDKNKQPAYIKRQEFMTAPAPAE